jgi:hypothetical protein
VFEEDGAAEDVDCFPRLATFFSGKGDDGGKGERGTYTLLAR